MKNRVYFLPGGQAENLGDQLINAAMLDAIRPHAEIVIDDLEAPRWFVDAIGRAGDDRFSAQATGRFFLSLAKQAIRERIQGVRVRNFVVLPPGHTSRRGGNQARAAMGRYSRLFLLRLLGCRIVRAGFSIGPFDSANAIVESLGSLGFSFYGVRDRDSLALARKLRIRSRRYFPDLAWSGQFDTVRLPSTRENGPVVLSFRSNAFGQAHSADYLLPIQRLLRRLLSVRQLEGRRIVIAYQVQSDREASRELFEGLRAAGFPVELRTGRLDLAGARTLYRDANCVLSNRLHVLLLAAQSGTLPVAVVLPEDNAKITSMLRDNDLEDLSIRLNEDEELAQHKLQEILMERPGIMERLDRVRQENSRVIAEILERMFHPVPDARDTAGARPSVEGEVR